ncbi:peroxiredoxin [Roseivirga sp. BDSF3-8]|uniref:peroxiredoxin n=1 Tax=Roseivirga sp. BDSF3-8 TaxID=3241598 RepID=UPI003532381D
MPLKKNDAAPDFSLPSTSGGTFTLSKELNEKPAILYFYPKDFTPGCTKEACSFRDEFAAFRDLEVKVLGISRDNIETHQRFRKEHNLPFHLLSDRSGEVAKKYKALIPVVKLPRRVTYLIGADRKILAVYEDMFGAENHIRRMIREID